MPFVPIADTAKLEIVGHDSFTLQEVANIVHARLFAADATQANVDTLATTLHGVLTGSVLNSWSSDMVFDYVRATSLETATSPQSKVVFSPGVTGAGDAAAPAGVCALLKVSTNLRGRSGRGRVYHGPIAADALTSSSVVGNALKTAVNNTWNAIEAALVGLSFPCELVIASKKLGVSNPWVSWGCESIVAYQRRRGMR